MQNFDRLIIHVIKLEKVITLDDKIVKFVGNDNTAVDLVSQAKLFTGDVESELPKLFETFKKDFHLLTLFQISTNAYCDLNKWIKPYNIVQELRGLQKKNQE